MFPLRSMLLVASALFVAACGTNSAPSDAPTGFAVQTGDTQVTVTWNQQPGLQYRVFRGRGRGITPQNWTTFPAADALFPVSSPLVIAGLTNGTEYSFNITAANDSPQGPAVNSIEATPRPAGGSWVVRAPLANALLAGVVFSNPNWVTGGQGGAVFSSTDGITWTARTSGITSDIHAVTYFASVSAGGAARFVVAGDSGAVAYSTDVANWTAASIGATVRINGLAPGASGLVAVGNGGVIYSSTDAITWTARSSGTTQDLYGAANLNGLYAAFGAGGTLLTSTDLITWTARASGVSTNLRAGVTGSASYAIFGDAGTYISSTDGLSWTTRTALGPENLLAATFVTQWVVTGSGGVAYTSADATTWTRVSTGSTADLTGVQWGNRRIVAVGSAGAILTSD